MESFNAGGKVRCSSMHGDLIAFGVEKDVVVYRTSDLADGREIARMGFDGYIWSVAISPCGTLVVAGLINGRIEMRSLLDAAFKRVFQERERAVKNVLFSFCGPRGDMYPLMISWLDSHVIRIWDSATGECMSTFVCEKPITGMTLLPEGQEILAGTSDNTLIMIGMDGIKKREVQIEGEMMVKALACANNNVVVWFHNGPMQLREAARLGHVIWSSQGYEGWGDDVCVSPSGAEIATEIGDNMSAIVSITTGKILRVFKGHTSYMRTSLFTPDGSKLITGSDDKTIRTWDLFPKSRKRLSSFIHPVDPEKLLYHGEDVVTELYYRLKRNLFAFGVEKE